MLKLYHISFGLFIVLFSILLLISYTEYSIEISKKEYSLEYKRLEKEKIHLDFRKSLLQEISKMFHYIWISSSLNETNKSNVEMWVRENIQTCLDLHPNWNYIIWTDDLVRREFPKLIDFLIAASVPSVISDILRMNIIARYGGIYMDTDFLCVRSFEPLLKQQYCTAFAASAEAEEDNMFNLIVSNGLIGAKPEHILFRHAVKLILEVALGPELPVKKTGPYFLAKMVRQFNISSDCMYVYNKKLFHQCDFNQRKQCRSRLAEYKKDPEIYAIYL